MKLRLAGLAQISAEGLEQRALWMGADAYITKPIDAFELPQLLRDKLAS